MAISPITFAVATPIRAVDKVERVRRRSKAEIEADADTSKGSSVISRTRAALTPEEMASDAIQEALQNIRLGG